MPFTPPPFSLCPVSYTHLDVYKRQRLLRVLAEGLEGQVGHVNVGLGDDLERRVHREHGYADVDGRCV